ncbi:MAG: V-type ATPase subunit [Candidatus Micrarchaeia archaeon]
MISSPFASIKNFRLKSVAGSIASYITFKPLIYGYANARVHGMFSNMLSEQQIREMVNARSVQPLSEMLERTPYKKDLVELSLRFKDEELIGLALGQNFASFANELLLITPSQGLPIINALLSRWDAHNLKTIILARKQHKSFDAIKPYLMIAGSLDKNTLKELLLAPSAEEFYSKLRLTNFGAGLMSSSTRHLNGSIKKMILSMGQDDASLEPLLGVLDIYAYRLIDDVSNIANQDSRHLRPMLVQYSLEKNLSTTLRLLQEGHEPEKLHDFIVPGGDLEAWQWVNLARLKDPMKIMSALSRRLPLQNSINAYAKTKKISTIEVELSRELAKRRLKRFRNAQLSLSVIVGALFLKEQEVSNIQKIVRAKSLGLSPDEINQMMVLVK